MQDLQSSKALFVRGLKPVLYRVPAGLTVAMALDSFSLLTVSRAE